MVDGPNLQFDAKLDGYLRRLIVEYAETRPDLVRILSAAHVVVEEGSTYDGWDGGTYGHDVRFFLPTELMNTIRIGDEHAMAETIAADLNKCAAALSRESVNRVILEEEDENDPVWKAARPVSRHRPVNPEMLTIWKPGLLRVFISHRDEYRVAARALADALEGYGVSAFVAHEAIEATAEWQREVENGLETMDAMVAYITDDFHASPWTDQEVGWALARRTPIISLRVGNIDPGGFLASKQAKRGHMDGAAADAKAIFGILAERLGNKARLHRAIIEAFTLAPDWNEARDRFERMAGVVNTLSHEEADQIAAAFAANTQLHGAAYLTNHNDRLKRWLEKVTRHSVVVTGRTITFGFTRNMKADLDDDIPF